jgi:hypothetical protein
MMPSFARRDLNTKYQVALQKLPHNIIDNKYCDRIVPSLSMVVIDQVMIGLL